MFIPQDTKLKEEYETGWKIIDIMPVYTSCITTGRDALAIDMDESTMRNRIAKLRGNLPDETIAAEFGLRDYAWWNLRDARQQLRDDPNWEKHFQRILYRPFDIRHIYYHNALVDGDRKKVMRHMLGGSNMGIVTTRMTKDNWSLLSTIQISETKSTCRYDRGYLFPLYLYPGKSLSSSMIDSHRRPNFSLRFLAALSNAMGLPQSDDSDGLPSGVSPEDIFGYIYAVLHSPEYRRRYRDFLRIDFPRIPLPKSLKLFRQLAALGNQLVSLHLLNHPALQSPAVQFSGHPQVVKVGWTKDNGGAVWLDGKGNRANFKRGTSGFSPVPEKVWKHHIGGYQVCEKWLKDRAVKKGDPPRILSDEEILHYRRIVTSIASTIRLMNEVDKTIHSHGNFPNAFVDG